MKREKLFKYISFGLFAIIAIVLMIATVAEKLYGTAYAMENIYHAEWMIALWGVATTTAIVYILQRKLHRQPVTLCLHLAFAVILIGALTTHINGKRGEVHLREGEYTNIFILPDGSLEKLPFSYYDSRIEFRQSRELARFLSTDKREQQQQEYIAYGELMHLVLSEVEKREDLDSALRNILELRGLIATSKQYDKVKDILERALANPKARSWFDGTYKLFNERSILVAGREESSRRPDRVMIKGDTAIVVDYKFAHEDSEHNKQVKDYMNLLSAIGYRNVSGYVWYVYKNEIKEV